MKKIVLLATALMFAGATTFAHEGKSCCKGKGANCKKEAKADCKDKKGCCKKNGETTAKK